MLRFVRRELNKDGTKILENLFDALVENNIGWCLLQQSRFKEARECYDQLVERLYKTCLKGDCKEKGVIEMLKEIFGESMSEFFDKQFDIQNIPAHTPDQKKRVEEWKRSCHMKISYLNNMGECYLKVGKADEREIAQEIFDLILNIEPENGIACLYRGGCETESEKRTEWFERAFRLAPEKIEVRSSYFINLVEMYRGQKDKKEKYDNAIREFVDYNPYSYSLNMCLALLRWKCTDENGKIKDCISQVNSENEDFLKKFSRITLYNELGTRAFHRLKNKSGFCYLKSAERGLVLANLLYLYEPIIKIRRKCHFQYDDWKALVEQTSTEPEKNNGETNRKYRSGLVHYTTLDTLKALLDQDGRPYLRISNSGYMNDSSEGEIFFEEMRYAVREMNSEEGEKDNAVIDIDKLIKEYFRELQVNSDEVLPRGGNVFITSLSTRADSFPMWDIYAEKHQGCNIEFDEGFYNLKGSSWGILESDSGKDNALEYGISTYTDDDYPLYEIQYIYRDHYSECGKSPNPTRICKRDEFGDNSKAKMEYGELSVLLKKIAVRWHSLDKILKELEANNSDSIVEGAMREAHSEICAFVADRINEVRYLFKDRDYSFEGEVRLVKVADVDEMKRHTDDRKIPHAYTEMDKEITDITVTLASKIGDEQMNEITTWLKHTDRVKNVRIAMRNRLRHPLVQSQENSN